MCAHVTWTEFKNAVTENGYPEPDPKQYEAFVHRLPTGGITDKVEAAMFLAQILWESGGLRHKREINPGHGYDRLVGVNGQDYYGRGYIQLTHSYNYRDASQELFGDNRLLTNPDMVADNEDYAWATAFWFWKRNVHNRAGVQNRRFGDSTRAINSMECTNSNLRTRAQQRFQIYRVVLRAFNIQITPDESGCYN